MFGCFHRQPFVRRPCFIFGCFHHQPFICRPCRFVGTFNSFGIISFVGIFNSFGIITVANFIDLVESPRADIDQRNVESTFGPGTARIQNIL